MNLRFGLFIFVYLSLGIIVNALFLIFFPLAFLFDPQRRIYIRILYFHHYLVSSLFWETEVTGYPIRRCRPPCIFVMNHQTILDSFTLFAMDPLICKLVMASGFKLVPVIGTITIFVKMVFVNRASDNSKKTSLSQSVACLEKGVSLILAPEGRLSHSRELGPFKIGAFSAADAAGVPVIPARTESRLLLEEGSRMKLRRGTMRLHLFDPIETRDRSPEEVRDLAFQAINSISLE